MALPITMTAYGQSGADITVTAPVIERELYQTPVSISVVRPESIKKGQPKVETG